jgi:hypothetical protein
MLSHEDVLMFSVKSRSVSRKASVISQGQGPLLITSMINGTSILFQAAGSYAKPNRDRVAPSMATPEHTGQGGAMITPRSGTTARGSGGTEVRTGSHDLHPVERAGLLLLRDRPDVPEDLIARQECLIDAGGRVTVRITSLLRWNAQAGYSDSPYDEQGDIIRLRGGA